MVEALSEARLQQLLLATSRTFAVSIPVLEEPLRQEVTLAYLLFRIADTFEDAATWSRERRLEALSSFGGLLDATLTGAPADVEPEVAVWLEGDSASDHAGYLDLLKETPGVLAALAQLSPEGRATIVEQALRTTRGMAEFVMRSDSRGHLELRDWGDLEAYCYTVAGIVGELLTDLFILHEPSVLGAETDLRSRASAFGEALQLVNILKDSEGDGFEGRRYLPRELDRSVVFERARHDLVVATEYVSLLQGHGASRGTVAFTSLPVLLARSTLDQVERFGPGAKVDRQTVMELVDSLNRRLDQGAPAIV